MNPQRTSRWIAALLASTWMASAVAALPTPEDFLSRLEDGRIAPARFDFVAAGYWKLPQSERLVWYGQVMQALDPASNRHPPCSIASQRRWDGMVWFVLLAQVANGEEWSEVVTQLRGNLSQLGATLTEAGKRVTASEERGNVHELALRAAYDQAIREDFAPRSPAKPLSRLAAQAWPSIAATRMTAIDCDNTAWLRGELANIAWFDIPTYGAEADNNAWLLVQHADRNPEFQREMLERLEKLPPEATSRKNLAYLHDRVARAAGKPQRYGTQGACQPDGTWVPHQTEDPANLDQRRQALGLDPIAKHAVDLAARACPKPTH
jgi:hypothetical protein